MVKLIFKLLFKLCVPIICLAGVVSYGVYMRGGDPAVMFKTLAKATVERVKSSASDAEESVKDLASTAVPFTSTTTTTTKETTFYKWTDAQGVTHFGSAPPDGVATETLSVKTKTRSSPPGYQADAAQAPAQAANAGMKLGPDGQPLPGVAGMNLPTGGNPEALLKFLQTMQGQQPAQ